MSVNLKEARVALAVADIVQVVELSTSKSWRIGVEGRLQSLRWDALSEGYLLCAFQDGSLSLYDVKEKRAVQSFSRQAGLSDVSWIRSMPGMFVSGTSRNDVLRLWNVSQGQPVSQIRIESGAGISAIVDTPRKEEAIVAFKDGSLCVANLRGERVSWSFEGGHTETVFSCRFSPNDDHLLASASYDGSIRLWDLEMNRQQSHIQVSTSAPLFSLAWSLDGRRVAASGHYGRTFLVDTEKGKVNQVVEHHNSNEPVLRVDQHPTDPELLASSGKDGLLCVFDWNGALKQRFTHRKQLMVCEWHPLREGLLAVSCADGNIYVWDYQRPNTPLQRFGHNNEVSPFGVSWSPHQPELLCVTCDNCTACVWNIDDGTCSTLTGHTSKVRACLWHPEIPNILLTGSWDNSIRVYDVHTSTCIYQAVEHVSDVYAFSIHPNRPFRMTSCSRDTTIRVWSLASYAGPWIVSSFNGNVKYGESDSSTPLKDQQQKLSGKGSLALKSRLEKMQKDLDRSEAIAEFCSTTSGVHRLFELARQCRGEASKAKTNDGEKILHCKELMDVLGGRAAEMESVRSNRTVGIGASRKEEILRRAASLHLQLGNVDAYCDIMKHVGEWDKAIAAAPAVSQEYWAKLVKERAQALEESEVKEWDILPLRLFTGGQHSAIETLMSTDQLDDAFIIAVTDVEGGYDHLSVAKNQQHHQGDKEKGSSSKKKLAPLSQRSASSLDGRKSDSEEKLKAKAQMLRIMERKAEKFMQSGEPVFAACCNLSVNEIWPAIAKLVRGWEFPLAAAVSRACGGAEGSRWARNLNFSLLEQAGKLDQAVDVVTGVDERRVRLLAAFASSEERKQLLRLAGLTTSTGASESGRDVESQSSSDSASEAALLKLLTDNVEASARELTEHIDAILSQSSWSLDDVKPACDVLCCIRQSRLPTELQEKAAAQLCYVGALIAKETGRGEATKPLLDECRRIISQNSVEFPLSNDKLEYQGASNTASGDVKLVSKELKAVSAPSHDASRLVEQIKLTSGSHEENAEAEQPVQRESSSAGALLWTPSCEVPEFFGQAAQDRILDYRQGKADFNEMAMWLLEFPISPVSLP